jgi:hypothetical protein
MSTPGVKGPGNNSATAVPPETTSTPKTSDTSGNSPTSSTSSTPSAEETKSSQQLANAKKEEFVLLSISRTLNSALDSVKNVSEAIVKESEIKNVEESAKKSGLEDDETKKLTDRLRGMDTEKFGSETKFLKENVLNTPNTDRALRTYNELKGMQDNNTERLQDKHIHLLTKGVAQPRATYKLSLGPMNVRIPYPTGKEGVLGQDGAKKAAEALIGMPSTDYTALNALLDEAGKKEGKTASGSNPDFERVLILKTAGAHHQTLSNPSEVDRAWTLAGEPSAKMSEIIFYASDIRGEKSEKLAQISTSIDPYWGNNSLQQRWNHSCGPTSAQGMKAEIDPMYAMKLHKEFVHSLDMTDKIAAEQKEVLEKPLGGQAPGIAVPRGAPGGLGSIGHLVMNDQIQKYTQTQYSLNNIPNTNEGRGNELDRVAEKLKAGVDVPIGAAFPNGSEHFMYLTDVHGSGNDQKFLLTDPWTGTTSWMPREELIKPRAQFPNSTDKGTMYVAYY